MNDNTKEFIDVLDREKTLDDLQRIIKNLSINNKYAMYSLNGSWGIGKTWILNSLEQRISDENIVIRYNAWENDFYDEPLIAILSIFVDKLNELKKQKIKFNEKLVAVIESSFKILCESVNDLIKFKSGIDIIHSKNKVKELLEKYIMDIDVDKSFNPNINIDNIKKKIRESLLQITEQQTIVVFVDELDRCLPQYAIKVLERLHHIFNDIPNLQVLVAVDKEQLEKTVKDIYGEKVDTDKYLNKFFDFEYTLNIGHINDNVCEQTINLNKYYESIYQISNIEEIKMLINYVLNNISVFDNGKTNIGYRKVETILHKAQMLHNLILDKNKKYDYLYCCMDILICTIYEMDPTYFESTLGDNDGIDKLPIYKLDKFIDSLKSCNYIGHSIGSNKRIFNYFDITNMYGFIWYVFCRIFAIGYIDIYSDALKKHVTKIMESKTNYYNIDRLYKWDEKLNKEFDDTSNSIKNMLDDCVNYCNELIMWLKMLH